MASLKLTVHRGSRQIGGSCIELSCGDSRIVLDCGLLLAGMDGNSDAPAPTGSLEVPGLFGEGPKVDGILLSHAHPDHSGLIRETDPSIPVYSNRLCFKMAMTASIFANQPRIDRERQRVIESGKSEAVGSFRVTAYPVDHSISGACAFLMEAAGKRILYTGDLRFHGRKPGMRSKLLEACRERRIDLAITEGTALGRPAKEAPFSEKDLETEGLAQVKECASLVAAHFSPLNLDRLVSFCRIARSSGRIFVLDAYAAYVFHLAQSEKIKVPDPFESESIRLHLPKGFWESRAGRAIRKLRPKMEARSIDLSEVLGSPERFLMLWRPSMLEPVFGGALPEGTLCFRSLWKGYLDTDEERSLREKLRAQGVEQRHLHASGHADRAGLIRFLKELDPKRIAVVHSERPEAMREHFGNVLETEDGIPISIE